MDLSKFSDDDVRAIAGKDLTKVSEAGLRMLAGKPAAESEPSFGDQVLRKTALGGRAIGEGAATALTAAPDMILNSPVSQFAGPLGIMAHAATQATGMTPVQMMLHAANKVAGTKIPESKTIQGALENALTSAGAPTPETPGENLGYAMTKGASAALAGGAANGLQGGNAVRAALSGITGGGASEVTRQGGGGQGAQAAAGLIGGLTPTALELGAITAKNAIRPITKSGQTQMAADLLGKQASDPQKAAVNLGAAQEIIPGSPRTMGEASQDPGLMGIEKGLRNQDMAAFAPTISAQNTAQQSALSKLAGTEMDITAAENARKSATAPMREAAMSNEFGGTIGAPSQIVHDTINNVLASPAGKRETISKTMEWARKQIGNETDPASLYEIRKDLSLAQQGKLQSSSEGAPNASMLSQARGQLGDVIASMDNAIEYAAPGYKAYLARYKELSKPINQMEVLQEIQKRAQLTSMDAMTREQFLGPAKYSNAVDAALVDAKSPLTVDQVNQLKAIRTDLQYGQALNSRLIKPAGSDTFQNLSIAQVLGAGESTVHPMMKIISKPLSWIYKKAETDNSVNEILKAAAMDPKLAASLLAKATPKSVGLFSQSLRMKAMSGTLGTKAQLAAIQSRWSEDTDKQSLTQAVATP